MTLSVEEVERYARHIVLRHVGGPGQQKLAAARVLLVGAGALGSPLALYLAAAGVGVIGVVDPDAVSLSNLQRQVIYAADEVGAPKVERAAAAITRLNPHVRVEAHPVLLEAANAGALVARYDVVADGSDNFATRYLVSDACFHEKKPLVTAAVNVFDGSVTTLRPHERNAAGEWNPTYRCLFPVPPPAGLVPTCSEAGVLGALAGVVGSLQAVEVLRAVVGFGEPLVGRLLLVDALDMRFETVRYERDPANPLNGDGASVA